MKKNLFYLLSVSFIISFLLFTVCANVKDAEGTISKSNIRAFINNVEIPSCHINNKTVVYIDDLTNFGFTVKTSGSGEKMSVTRNRNKSTTEINLSILAKGRLAFPETYKKSGITVIVNGKPVDSFEIGGKTAIYFGSLGDFGTYEWDAEKRYSLLYIENLLSPDKDLIKKITLLQENPETFFEDIIFLGDSVTTGFSLFKNSIKYNGEKILSKSAVVASGSYGVYNATREVSDKTIHPKVNGIQIPPEDNIATQSGSVIFICLGLNDIGWQSPTQFIGFYDTLINRIKEKSPDKKIVIMSITPVTETSQSRSLNNARIQEYNKYLSDYANENSILFLDYASALRDSNGALPSSYASDNFCHLTISAYERLVAYIIENALLIYGV